MSNCRYIVSQIITVITVLITAIFLFVPAASAEIIETDLGVVHYSQAPKTWTIDVPQNFNKVEVAHYSSGKIEANKYMGWNGYLKLNGQYVWEFLRFDATLGGIIYDYIAGVEVRESTGKGLWLDVTGSISAGSNTITYYHYNEGNGIGVKVRIYTTATTPVPTPVPTPIPTPIPTSAPTITAVPITSASIRPYGISSSYFAGDTLTATLYVRNTGETYHTFPVGFSVRDPDGTWIDVPYKTATLSAGADTNIYFEYKIPSSGTAGTWTARAAVWDRDAGGGILETRYDFYDKSFSVSIPATATPTATVTSRQVQGEFSVSDLGVVHYTQAPKTWTIDIPQNFNKVEVAVYGSGKDETNQFEGWDAYLQLNGEYAWKFVRYDTKLGGIFYDYEKKMEIQESTVRGKWFDVTGRVKAGKNTITYYHYTAGDGIGVKVRIYTLATTSLVTPTTTSAITLPTTPAPTETYIVTSTPKKASEKPQMEQSPDEIFMEKFERVWPTFTYKEDPVKQWNIWYEFSETERIKSSNSATTGKTISLSKDVVDVMAILATGSGVLDAVSLTDELYGIGTTIYGVDKEKAIENTEEWLTIIGLIDGSVKTLKETMDAGADVMKAKKGIEGANVAAKMSKTADNLDDVNDAAKGVSAAESLGVNIVGMGIDYLVMNDVSNVSKYQAFEADKFAKMAYISRNLLNFWNKYENGDLTTEEAKRIIELEIMFYIIKKEELSARKQYWIREQGLVDTIISWIPFINQFSAKTNIHDIEEMQIMAHDQLMWRYQARKQIYAN